MATQIIRERDTQKAHTALTVSVACPRRLYADQLVAFTQEVASNANAVIVISFIMSE